MTYKTLSLAVAILCTAAACVETSARKPAPEAIAGVAAPYGSQSNDHFIRHWGDKLTLNGIGGGTLGDYAERIQTTHADQIKRNGVVKLSMLALSGGRPDGAYGAGLLNGWTARGDRPEFSTVTGVSTGAIIALFAFLGPEYDQKLGEVYT